MRPGNDVPLHVALPPAAQSSLHASADNGRAARFSRADTRTGLASTPNPPTRISVNPRISLKPSGFPSLRENL